MLLTEYSVSSSYELRKTLFKYSTAAFSPCLRAREDPAVRPGPGSAVTVGAMHVVFHLTLIPAEGDASSLQVELYIYWHM